MKDADGIANSVDLDQTAHLGLHCLANIYNRLKS